MTAPTRPPADEFPALDTSKIGTGTAFDVNEVSKNFKLYDSPYKHDLTTTDLLEKAIAGWEKVNGDPHRSPLGKRVEFTEKYAAPLLEKVREAKAATVAHYEAKRAELQATIAAADAETPKVAIGVVELARAEHLKNLPFNERFDRFKDMNAGRDDEMLRICAALPCELWGGKSPTQELFKQRVEARSGNSAATRPSRRHATSRRSAGTSPSWIDGSTRCRTRWSERPTAPR